MYFLLNEVSMFPLADMFWGQTRIRHSKALIFKQYDASEGVKEVQNTSSYGNFIVIVTFSRSLKFM